MHFPLKCTPTAIRTRLSSPTPATFKFLRPCAMSSRGSCGCIAIRLRLLLWAERRSTSRNQGGQFSFDDGSQGITPADFAKIYNVQPLYDAGINGTGQSIAIVGRSNIDVQDIRDFRNLLGLPVNDPQIIVNGDDPGITPDVDEATLDVTWSGAVAPMAKIDFVVSQSNFADGVDVSAEYIVDNNLAPVMSTSYGSCENDLGPVENAFYNSLWQQAAAQGITSFVASGDNGGAGCDAPAAAFIPPASSPSTELLRLLTTLPSEAPSSTIRITPASTGAPLTIQPLASPRSATSRRWSGTKAATIRTMFCFMRAAAA